MADWDQGLFGCFGNCMICIQSYFIPCVVYGKNAAYLDKSCLCHTLLFFVPFLNVYLLCLQRGDIREKRGIEGGALSDLLRAMFCAPCSLAQVTNEISVLEGGQSIARE